MNKQFHLTQDGIDELKAELAELQGQRSEIAERIRAARDLGDLRENAEYSAARQEQEKNEDRINEIGTILKNVVLIKKPKDGKVVQLGSRVALSSDGKKKELQVVGTVEADPLEGKISDESPIGKALLGKKLGEEVEITTPSETTTYRIDSIE